MAGGIRTLLTFSLLVFVYSGLVKWLDFPIDPTILFFAVTAVLTFLFLHRTKINVNILMTILFFVLLYIWIALTCRYTISEAYWKEKLIRALIAVPAFLLPVMLLKKKNDFILLREAYALLLIAGLSMLTYEYYDNQLRRLIDNTPDERMIPEYLNISIFLLTGSLFLISMRGKTKYVIIFFCIFYVILLGARAPLIFVVISFLTFLFLRGYIKELAIAMVTVILLVIFSHSIPGFERLTSRFSGVPIIGETVDSSVGGRFKVYGLSVESIKQRPLLGTGLGGFSESVYGVDEVSTIHNIFLEIWVELGLPGLIIASFFMLSTAVNLRSLYKRNRLDPLALSLICICCFHFLELMVSSKMEDWRVPFFWIGVSVAYCNYSLITNKN